MGFFDIIISKAQVYRNATKLSNKSWSSTLFTNLQSAKPTATDTFIDDLTRAGVVWGELSSYQKNANNKQAIAHALFKYCISRQLDAQTHPVYDQILHELGPYHAIEAKELELFYNDILSVLRDHMHNYKSNSKCITDPIQLISDIIALTFSLFAEFKNHFDERQAQLLLDSELLSTFLPVYFKKINTNAIVDPVIIKALQIQPQLGVFLLEKLLEDTSGVDSKPFYILFDIWLWLLEHEAIAVDASISYDSLGQNTFIQTWHRIYLMVGESSHKDGVSSVGALYTLIKQNKLINLPVKTKNELLSLVYIDGHTPLQKLATVYMHTRRSDIVDLIIALLEQQSDVGFSLQYEKDPIWIETLLLYLDDELAWKKIMPLVTPSMWTEFHQRGLVEKISKQLVEKIQAGDFWTQSLIEQRSSDKMILLDILKKMTTIEDKVIQAFDNNVNQLSICLMPAVTHSTPHYSFKATYLMTSDIYHQVQQAINANAPQAALISVTPEGIQEKPPLDDHYKKELSTSIEKSLRFLERHFSLYPLPVKMIDKFIHLSINIDTILKSYHCTCDEIIFSNPVSKAIIKNMLANMLLFAYGVNEYDALCGTTFYKAVATPITRTQASNWFVASDIESYDDIRKYLTELETQTQNYRQNPFRLYKKDNDTNRNCTEFIKHSIVDTFLIINENVHEGRMLVLVIKAMLQIIDYRIISYTDGDKYEKGFYREYLTNKNLIPTDAMMKDLKRYKPFVIAQLNSSLRKLNTENYQDLDRAESLYHYLSSLLLQWGIRKAELDNNAQTIYGKTALEVHLAMFKSKDAAFIRQLLTDPKMTHIENEWEIPIWTGTDEGFNPEKWHPLYARKNGGFKDNKLTALQYLALLYLSDKTRGNTYLALIMLALENKPVRKENHENGHWIETLLLALHKDSSENKQFFVDNIILIIPIQMWTNFFQTGMFKKIMENLVNESNPLVDSQNDAQTYQIYFLLFLRALHPHLESDIESSGDLIEHMCHHILFYSPESPVHQYFELKYKNMSDGLRGKIRTHLEKNITDPTLFTSSDIKKSLCKIVGLQIEIPVNLTEYILACYVCRTFIPVMFLNLDSYPLQHSPPLAFKESTKAAISQAIEKFIHHSLQRGGRKWYSIKFLSNVLSGCNKVASRVGFDISKILTEKNKKVFENYAWVFSPGPHDFGSFEEDLYVAWAQDKALSFIDEKTLSAYMDFLTAIRDSVEKYFVDTLNYENHKNEHQYSLGIALFFKITLKLDFKQTFLKIIDYRLGIYDKDIYEPHFYLQCLKAPLEKLKNKLSLSDFYKDHFFYEIKKTLQDVYDGQKMERFDPSKNVNDAIRLNSLRITLALFSEVLGLGQHFEDFDYAQYKLPKLPNYTDIKASYTTGDATLLKVANINNINNNKDALVQGAEIKTTQELRKT